MSDPEFTTSYSNDTKNSSSFGNDDEMGADFMLKEDTFHLLLETGFRIVLSYGTEYSRDTKYSTSY